MPTWSLTVDETHDPNHDWTIKIHDDASSLELYFQDLTEQQRKRVEDTARFYMNGVIGKIVEKMDSEKIKFEIFS
jgi:hypothetical protein